MGLKERVLWDVVLSPRADKEKLKLPVKIQEQIAFLIKEMEVLGPYRTNWKNYKPLSKGRGIPENAFHCHLKKGKPTYVACWQIVNKEKKKIEVYYVGTHENAPY
jgi:hypothetical protein